MTSEEQLELEYKLASQQLAMAENLGSWIAIVTGLGTGYLFGWIAAVVTAPVLFYAITYVYRDPAFKAKDAYLKSAKIGQYAHLRDKPAEE